MGGGKPANRRYYMTGYPLPPDLTLLKSEHFILSI